MINVHLTNCPSLIGNSVIWISMPTPNSLSTWKWCFSSLRTAIYSITHTHLFGFCSFDAFFSFSKGGGWTTTCMIVTPPGISHNGLLQSPTVMLLSSIFPALINLTSFTVLGPFSFSLGHRARMLSFKFATLVAAGKLLGPISDPSINRNLISNWSCTPDIIQFHTDSQYPNTRDLSLGSPPKQSTSNTSN